MPVVAERNDYLNTHSPTERVERELFFVNPVLGILIIIGTVTSVLLGLDNLGANSEIDALPHSFIIPHILVCGNAGSVPCEKECSPLWAEP